MENIRRTRINDLLKKEDFGTVYNVKGWVRTRRGSKQVSFIALNDGSTIHNIQVVADLAKFPDTLMKDITTGACLSVNGILTESVGSGQKVELQAEEIAVLGTCDNTYPLQKKGHSMEFLREIAHLRPRTNTFGAVFRIRHNMAIAIHKFFHEHGFYYFHTPIITASDCEGAGQMFQVTTMNLYDLKKDENGQIIYDDDFFGKPTSLTVSGQLEGELAATALGAIYTFGPTFRAENSNTPRHLAEFWMIEPEIAFADIHDLMDLEEEFIKYCVQWALDNCQDDLLFLNKMVDNGLIERLQKVVNTEFVRLPYTEGINILEEAVANGHKFEFPVYWGCDLASEHERFLVEQHFQKPAGMQGESLFVPFQKRFGRLFMDSLSQIGHQLPLYVHNVETVGFRNGQRIRILQQQSLRFQKQQRRIRNAQSRVRTRFFHGKPLPLPTPPQRSGKFLAKPFFKKACSLSSVVPPAISSHRNLFPRLQNVSGFYMSHLL